MNETDTRIAAAPVGKPSSDSDEFHLNLKAFEDQEISTSVQIPLYVTQDDSGNPVNGPMTYPPYNKAVGQNYVACDDSGDLKANYNYISEKKAVLVRHEYTHLKPANRTSIIYIGTALNILGSILNQR